LEPDNADPNQTKLLSSFLLRMGEQRGYLVRIYPVNIGEGIINLPSEAMILGREMDCGLVLADHDVSRHHAAIELHGMDYTISDLGSTNGTLINDKEIDHAVLDSGDLIRVGKTILKFLRGDDVEKQYHETVYSMMIHDGLTGIANKRFFEEALQRELTRSQRHARPLSLVLFDIDRFKDINDTYGHLSGDVVLRELCSRVRNAIRKDEVFARYGGEEFVVLLPEASLEQARQFAERIRLLVSTEPITPAGTPIHVTISLGVAHTMGEKDINPDDFFERADRKMYEAKSSGRNRVVS